MHPSVTEDLLQQIAHAFLHVSRPNQVTKRVARALDDEWVFSDERWRELYTQDTETEWTQLTDDEIEEFCFILPWLDDAGLRFYLPAFMSYCLRRFPDQDHRAVCDTQAACADFARYSLFTEEQLKCIHGFLDLYSRAAGDSA